MTKIRFIINFFVVLLVTVLGIFFSGNSLNLYIDIASLILGIILPYIVVSLIFSPSEQIQINREIFKPDGTGDKTVLESALVYFKSFKKILIYSGIVWTIMGTIGISVHLEGPEVLGANLAVLVIVPLYVSLFLLIVVEPLRASAEKSLKA